jgi:hypothetical protein
MVLRMIEQPDAEQKKKNYKESIQLANKAVTLDLGDSQSWCKYNLSPYKYLIQMSLAMLI